MTPVTVDSGATVAGGSGNTGWSAIGTFQRPAKKIGVISDLSTGSVSAYPVGKVTTGQKLAQSFTPGHAMSVSAIAAIVKLSGAPTDSITIEIRNNVSNAPGSTVLGTSDAVAASNLTSTYAWINVPFSTPVSLSSGTKYWMTFQRTGSTSDTDYYNVGVGLFVGYAGGDRADYNGTSWTVDTNRDVRMRVIEDVTGDQPLYQITQDTALHAWKSTDSGATWTEQDAANAPTVNSSTASWSAAMSQWGEIGVVYFSGTNTLRVRVFDAHADTWATADLASANATTDADPLSPVRIVYRDAYFGTYLVYTSIADTADINIAKRAASTWATQGILAATSAERSIVSDTVQGQGLSGFGYPIYYDTGSDDVSFVSASINLLATLSVWTEVDLDTTAATSEASHASGAFQIYDNGSGIDKILAAYIDSDGSVQERTMQLGVLSTSVTLGTQHQVTSSTSYAGRQLATCKYGSDLYVFANTATGIDYWVDAGATGSWSSVTNWKTGLTSAALSQALSVPGVGILVSYMDNGNVVIDWAVGGPVSDITVNGTTATSTAAANAGSVSIPRNVTGTTATATGSANTGTITAPANPAGTTATVTAVANAGTRAWALTGTTATATGSANTGSLSYAATVAGTTATATGAANAGSLAIGSNATGTTATATASANAGTLTYGASVTGSTATATATANAGVVSYAATANGTTATANASANTGSVTYGANVTGSTATVTANANAGTLSVGGAVTVNGTTATATSAANAGTLSYNATATGQTATATSTANAGSISAGATVTGQTATVNASANAGVSSVPVTVNGTTATVSASANTGSALAPVNVTGQTATVSAAATTSSPSIVRTGQTATVQAITISGSIFTGTAATVSGNTATIVIDAYAGTITQLVIAGHLSATLVADHRLSGRPDHGRKVSGGLRAGRALTATLEAEK